MGRRIWLLIDTSPIDLISLYNFFLHNVPETFFFSSLCPPLRLLLKFFRHRLSMPTSVVTDNERGPLGINS